MRTYTLEWIKQRVSVDATGCWIWNLALNGGYGMINVKLHGRKVGRAHRLAWELANGKPVPDSLQVLHTCDVQTCCNPEHLYVGTHLSNMKDYAERGQGYGFERTDQTVIDQILEEYDEGKRGCGMKALAKKYGLDRNTVRKFIRKGA